MMNPPPLLAAFAAGVALSAAVPALAQATTTASKSPPLATRTVKVLPPDVSRSLAITRMPTSRPIPMLIGTYWSCHDAGNGFDVCRMVLVVCTDDQSLCTEIP